LPPIGFVRSR